MQLDLIAIAALLKVKEVEHLAAKEAEQNLTTINQEILSNIESVICEKNENAALLESLAQDFESLKGSEARLRELSHSLEVKVRQVEAKTEQQVVEAVTDAASEIIKVQSELKSLEAAMASQVWPHVNFFRVLSQVTVLRDKVKGYSAVHYGASQKVVR